ncbi:hypothetical protein GBA63_03030 [Rubrobacter tropicus]|uniref:SCP domain-containing protein n=1 Tax=Rubrobacter tropicus TaxID=2653851 RepID=A0A6G8Q5K2_9ACTN|nr:CAP domain-containing protein [Rubrobacter tropicus]QIN81723.1 hypothetical protein GBA63_03030 [Rubrobacter tropicus]
MRYLSVLFGSVFVATAFAAAAVVTAPPEAEAATGGYVGKCGGGKIFLSADERQSFYLHNQQRKSHNLRQFCVHPTLQKVARAHSKDMIQRDYFSHTTKGTSRQACDRVKNAGYRFRYCGENIAYGSGSYGEPQSIMRSWMKSTGHRRNILNGKYREIGIGAYTGTYKGMRNTTMYTADFGTRL